MLSHELVMLGQTHLEMIKLEDGEYRDINREIREVRLLDHALQSMHACKRRSVTICWQNSNLGNHKSQVKRVINEPYILPNTKSCMQGKFVWSRKHDTQAC